MSVRSSSARGILFQGTRGRSGKKSQSGTGAGACPVPMSFPAHIHHNLQSALVSSAQRDQLAIIHDGIATHCCRIERCAIQDTFSPDLEKCRKVYYIQTLRGHLRFLRVLPRSVHDDVKSTVEEQTSKAKPLSTHPDSKMSRRIPPVLQLLVFCDGTASQYPMRAVLLHNQDSYLIEYDGTEVFWLPSPTDVVLE